MILILFVFVASFVGSSPNEMLSFDCSSAKPEGLIVIELGTSDEQWGVG